MADDPSGMDEERISRIADELQAASIGVESADLETPPTPAERREVTDHVGDATVIGLGETGHGISEMFGLRARICRVLAKEAGIRHFALEADATATRNLDAYVTDGDGTAREALASPGVYPFWQNQAMLEFLEWARSFNEGRSPDDQVRFHGIDVFEGGPTASALRSYLQRVDESLLDEVGDALETVAESSFVPEAQPTQEEALAIADACEHVVATLESALERNRGSYIEIAGEETFQRAQRQTAFIATLEKMANVVADEEESTIGAVRDRQMADNVLNILNDGPADRLIVLASDVHVTRRVPEEAPFEEPTMLGQRLHQQLGDAYRAIGASVGGGSTQAISTKSDESMQFDRVDVPEAPDDSLSGIFSRLEERYSLIDLGAVPDDGAMARWLDGGVPYRPVPSRADDEVPDVEIEVWGLFDGFLFSKEANPADMFVVE